MQKVQWPYWLTQEKIGRVLPHVATVKLRVATMVALLIAFEKSVYAITIAKHAPIGKTSR